ncbi:MAG: flagellar protein FliT [Verrucomicrobiota bacterium]
MIRPRTNIQDSFGFRQNKAPSKIQLLREVLESVMWEFNAIKERRWEELPALNIKKEQLLNRMSEFDWTPLPFDRENPEVSIIKGQIMDLEYQIQQCLKTHLDIIETQLGDLKERHDRWIHAVAPYRKPKFNS